MDNSKTRIPKTWLMIVLQLCFLFCGLSFAFNTLQKPEIIFADLPSLSYNSIYLDTAYSVSVGTCNNETNIVIPSEFNGKPVKTITEYGFQGCTNLVSITFPETLTVINRFAFYNCTSLLSITIPDSVTDICTEAFYNCTSLSEINFSDKDVCIGGYAFGNTAWLTNSNDGVVYAGKVAYLLKGNMLPETIITLKDGTLSIAMRAFESCNRLMSVVFPEGFENICSYAFLNCSGMTYINFPESLKNIDALAFSGCYNLSEVILPKNINNIGTNAFQSCLLLEKVIVKDFTPCTCGGGIFNNGNTNLKIFVPAEGVDAYKTANGWLTYASKIYSTPVILFNTNGGTTVERIEQEVGTTVNAPTSPSNGICTFSGWFVDDDFTQAYTFSTMPNECVTVYAKWIVSIQLLVDMSTCTLNFVAGNEFVELGYNSFVKTGYTNVGWLYGDNMINADTVFDYSNTFSLTAVFEAKTFIVSFISDCETEIADKNVVFDSQIGKLETPKKDGYVFVCWKTEDGTVFSENTNYKIDGNLILYAEWKKDPSITLIAIIALVLCGFLFIIIYSCLKSKKNKLNNKIC